MKIPNTAVHLIYDLCKAVQAGSLNRKEAMLAARESGILSEGSAQIYLTIFSHLYTGQCYKRAMNAYSYEFFLPAIRKDYGNRIYENAVNAAQEHFAYYNTLGKGRQAKAEKVVENITHKFPLTGIAHSQFPDEVPDAQTYFEGATRQVSVNVYERNPKARAECIRIHGLICSICDFDFEEVYGKIGIGFIHIHHLRNLADVGESYEVDPEKDLIPVCPNCHAMLHRSEAPSPQELRALVNRKRL